VAEARLSFSILARDNASKEFDKVGQSADRLGNRLGKGGLGKLGGIAKAGALGVAGLAAGMVAAAPKVLSLASNVGLMGQKSATVFGPQLGIVQKWASESARGMGLTNREAVGLAAGIGDLLKPMGFSTKIAAGMSTKIVGLSGALSQWSGGTKSAADVTEILSAAMLGERDGLQALGISISQAQVDAQVLANSKKGLKFATEEQAQAQATADLIMAKSTDAQKAYATSSGTLARKLAEGKATIKTFGETLLVKALPALTKITQIVVDDVIPGLERFGAFIDENKYQIQGAFIDIALAVTGLSKTFVPVFKFLDNVFLDFVGTIVNGAAEAFGWIPEIGPKLEAAQKKFTKYRDVHDKAFDAVIKKSNEWNTTLKKMKTDVEIKATISDLERKLKTAKTQLADKNLTKERRAQLTATKRDLDSKLNAAYKSLGNPALTKARVAKLQADKTDLDSKLNAALRSLKTPGLTATKRAQIQANIADLQSKIRTAQGAINGLKGKTVVIKYTATGVNLTAPSSVGRREHGGPVKKGQPYIVGEKRAEVFVPQQNGTILPSIAALNKIQGPEMVTRMNRMPRRPGGGTVVVNNFHIDGALDSNAVARQIQRILLNLKRTSRGDLGLA
jgi:hypothetical protein